MENGQVLLGRLMLDFLFLDPGQIICSCLKTSDKNWDHPHLFLIFCHFQDKEAVFVFGVVVLGVVASLILARPHSLAFNEFCLSKDIMPCYENTLFQEANRNYFEFFFVRKRCLSVRHLSVYLRFIHALVLPIFSFLEDLKKKIIQPTRK